MNVQFETDGPAARRSIENAIERLLAMLDHMEPDADLERPATMNRHSAPLRTILASSAEARSRTGTASI